MLEADTGKLVKVCDVGGRTPRGLTVDDNGNVFVCYLNPGEIRVWSRNMEERSLTIHGKLEFNPWAIVYCRKRQQLIVTNWLDNCIYNYKISSDI